MPTQPTHFDPMPYSVKAILECCGCFVLSITLAIIMRSPTTVYLSFLVVPLLLLRSPDSVRLGRILYFRTIPSRRIGSVLSKTDINKSDIIVEHGFGVLAFAIFLIMTLIIKIVCTLRFLYSGVTNLPVNWWNAAFCESIFKKPELIPNTESCSSTFERFVPEFFTKQLPEKLSTSDLYTEDTKLLLRKEFFLWYIETLKNDMESTGRFRFRNLYISASILIFSLFVIFQSVGQDLFLLLSSFFLFLMIISSYDSFSLIIYVISTIFAILYRFSLKSTFVFWLPLSYYIYKYGKSNNSIRLRLQELVCTTISLLVFWYSVVILLLFLIKLLMPLYISFEYYSLSLEFTVAGFSLSKIYLWEIVAFINAFLSISARVLFFEPWLFKIENAISPPPWADKAIVIIVASRSLLSTYIILCTVILVTNAVMSGRIILPRFESIIFPSIEFW